MSMLERLLKAMYVQESPIIKPSVDHTKLEAIKLSASISSSTHVPTPQDVTRAILAHNFSGPDIHKLDIESSTAQTSSSIQTGTSKSIGQESRKASRAPSLTTVMEESVLHPRQDAQLETSLQSELVTGVSVESGVIENPVVAQLKGKAGMPQKEFEMGLPSMRSEGMKSLSILEMEGIPQLRHTLKSSQADLSTESNSPEMRLVSLSLPFCRFGPGFCWIFLLSGGGSSFLLTAVSLVLSLRSYFCAPTNFPIACTEGTLPDSFQRVTNIIVHLC